MLQKKETTISNPYTDWQEAFDNIPNKDQMTIIELGCGEGTQYLLDNFKEVISIEYSRYPYDFTVISPKHTFVKLEASQETIEKDDVLIETMGETRPDFTEEVDMLIREIKKYKADMIFVDFGFHFRGEVVQALTDLLRIETVAYHDTNKPYYAYSKVEINRYVGMNYALGVWDKGQGTKILSLNWAMLEIDITKPIKIKQ